MLLLVGFVQGRGARKLFDEIPVTNQPTVNEAAEALGAAGDWHVFVYFGVVTKD